MISNTSSGFSGYLIICVFFAIAFFSGCSFNENNSSCIDINISPQNPFLANEPAFNIEFVNSSDEDITLEKQKISPQISVRIYDRAGKEVPKLFPPFPDRPENRRLLVLTPGGLYVESFYLSSIASTRRLNSGLYSIQVVYIMDEEGNGIEPASKPIYSNTLEFCYEKEIK